MYRLEQVYGLSSDFLQAFLMVIIAITIWFIIYGVYFSSGIKLMVDKELTWVQQMNFQFQ